MLGTFWDVLVRLAQLASRNREDLRSAKTDDERVFELRSDGWSFGKGEVWGQNDCLADSLLQLLVAHGVLDESISRDERREACRLNRCLLETSVDERLRPRSVYGQEGVCLKLE